MFRHGGTIGLLGSAESVSAIYLMFYALVLAARKYRNVKPPEPKARQVRAIVKTCGWFDRDEFDELDDFDDFDDDEDDEDEPGSFGRGWPASRYPPAGYPPPPGGGSRPVPAPLPAHHRCVTILLAFGFGAALPVPGTRRWCESPWRSRRAAGCGSW